MARGRNPKSLANLIPPKKGEVRNPKGINRTRPWTDRFFEMGETLLTLSAEGEKIRKTLKLDETATWSDAATYMLMRRAVRGEVAAIKEMADRIEGKAPERLEISGPQRREITFKVTYVNRKQQRSSE